MTELKEIYSKRSHEGFQKVFTHYSKNLKSVHEFSIYLPPTAVNGQRCPVLYWLTGAAADEREFMMKSGFQKYASENNLIVVAPEPSPGPPSNKNKEITAEYFVQFGFYLDATEAPYQDNFRMYSYVMDELLPLIDFKFPTIPDKRGVAGHSMGGMGALVFALRNPDIFRSVSCMSAICNPSAIPLGKQLLNYYFGDNQEEALKYDPSLLVKSYKGPHRHILFDQGGKDELWQIVKSPAFVDAVMFTELSLTFRLHAGYTHGIETIATFIEDHIVHHATELR